MNKITRTEATDRRRLRELTSSFEEFQDYVEEFELHSHANLQILNDLGEYESFLVYKEKRLAFVEDIPEGISKSNRTIVANDVYNDGDDLILIDPSDAEVGYIFPEAPEDNDELQVIALNLTNNAYVSPNGKLINNEPFDYYLPAANMAVKFRYVASQGSWFIM